jgi:hypothetical protein
MTTVTDKRVDEQSRLDQALAAVQAGDLESTRRQFEELAMDDAHDPLALYNLGLCCNEAGVVLCKMLIPFGSFQRFLNWWYAHGCTWHRSTMEEGAGR